MRAIQNTRQIAKIAIFCAALGLVLLIFIGNNWIQVSRYEIPVQSLPAAFDGLKIVHISDLHGRMFGPNNSTLLEIILKENPDMVICSGDMVDSETCDDRGFISLLRGLNRRFPVYYCLGNHEQSIARREGASAIYDGATLLDNNAVFFQRGGASIAIYGFTPPLIQGSTSNSATRRGLRLDVDLMRKSIGTPPKDKVTVLIAHDPRWFEVYAEWGARVVFCGHLHGGIIRIPGKGGLLSPDRTFFPRYDAGVFTIEGSTMHVSRGLGNSALPVRVLNRPDVSVITLRALPH